MKPSHHQMHYYKNSLKRNRRWKIFGVHRWIWSHFIFWHSFKMEWICGMMSVVIVSNTQIYPLNFLKFIRFDSVHSQTKFKEIQMKRIFFYSIVCVTSIVNSKSTQIYWSIWEVPSAQQCDQYYKHMCVSVENEKSNDFDYLSI